MFAAIGGSMGGMQVLEWAATFPDRLRTVIQTAPDHSAQNIAFHEVGRRPLWLIPIGMVAIISSMASAAGARHSSYGGAYHLFIGSSPD